MHRDGKSNFLLVIFAAIFLTSCGEGREFDQEDEYRLQLIGESWYETNEPTKDVYELAEAGDASAQSAVGTYLKKRNPSIAIKMLKDSSESGEIESFYQLGVIFLKDTNLNRTAVG